MDDEHFLALGRAVYAFQAMEWLTIWIAGILDGGDIARHDDKTFGVVGADLEHILNQDPAAGGLARGALDEVVPLLRSAVVDRHKGDFASRYHCRLHGQRRHHRSLAHHRVTGVAERNVNLEPGKAWHCARGRTRCVVDGCAVRACKEDHEGGHPRRPRRTMLHSTQGPWTGG